jgi:all-trans-retinol dehydrogenase (NAD+)
MRSLTNSRVLITGGAAGIGRAMAARFAASGAHPVLADIDEERAQEAAEQLRAAGHTASAHRLDVTDADAVAAAREQILAEGPIDVLVNNAGTVFGGYFQDVPLESHLATLRINALGPVIVTHAFLADLIDRPEAHVVNIASLAGYGGGVRASTYAASKWAVIGFSESLELELRAQGHHHVHVTTVCPGVVSTGLFEGARPLRLTRIVTPEQVADRVATGVLHDRAYVRLPWLVQVAPLLRGVLPHRAFNAVVGAFGGSATMDDWTGHAGTSAAGTPGQRGSTDRADGYRPTSV